MGPVREDGWGRSRKGAPGHAKGDGEAEVKRYRRRLRTAERFDVQHAGACGDKEKLNKYMDEEPSPHRTAVGGAPRCQ